MRTPRFEEIRRNESAIGGYHYRLMSNGLTVRIEERSPSSSSYRSAREVSCLEYLELCADTNQDTESDTWLYRLANEEG